jgi:hypothetical protein
MRRARVHARTYTRGKNVHALEHVLYRWEYPVPHYTRR